MSEMEYEGYEHDDDRYEMTQEEIERYNNMEWEMDPFWMYPKEYRERIRKCDHVHTLHYTTDWSVLKMCSKCGITSHLKGVIE